MITHQHHKAVAEAVLSATAFDRTYLVKTDLIVRLSSLFESNNRMFNEDEFWAACFNENDKVKASE